MSCARAHARYGRQRSWRGGGSIPKDKRQEQKKAGGGLQVPAQPQILSWVASQHVPEVVCHEKRVGVSFELKRLNLVLGFPDGVCGAGAVRVTKAGKQGVVTGSAWKTRRARNLIRSTSQRTQNVGGRPTTCPLSLLVGSAERGRGACAAVVPCCRTGPARQERTATPSNACCGAPAGPTQTPATYCL